MTNKHTSGLNLLGERFQSGSYTEAVQMRRRAEVERDALRAENEKLRAALNECIGFIEMKVAHHGVMNVEQIMKELARVRDSVPYVETSHHLGCNQTTRRVDLSKARAALARGEA